MYPVGRQVEEAIAAHRRIGASERREQVIVLLDKVGIPDAAERANHYPHQLSGGQRQRVGIAMALANDPDIIIADEPTSALDVTVRRQVLTVLDELVSRSGTGLMFISHDLNLVADFCDRVLVMYAGRIMEDLPAKELHKARHPYTQALLASLPRLDQPVDMLKVPEREKSWLTEPTLVGGVS